MDPKPTTTSYSETTQFVRPNDTKGIDKLFVGKT